MKQLYQPQSSLLTIPYRPDGEAVAENPPRFCWMPPAAHEQEYQLEISADSAFPKADTLRFSGIQRNFFTPDRSLGPGVYFWRYTTADQKNTWSTVRQFTVSDGLPETALPDAQQRYQAVSSGHPRLWLNAEQLESLGEKIRADRSVCGFDAFFAHTVQPLLESPPEQEPSPYPENKRVISLWRQSYIRCQRMLNRIRSLAVAGRLLADQAILQQAKQALLAVAAWKTDGVTSRAYNDESAFRTTEALAWGYDWLYDQLDSVERDAVRIALLTRTREIANHVIISSKIHYSIYDSHAVRSLSSVLTPACLAMLGEVPEAKQWLDYTIEYFSAVYTPWGGVDGGWAEGGMYWTTGMAFLLGALNLLRNALGLNLFARPFFQNTGDFPLYCFPHDTSRASFCDQSNLGDNPCLKTGFNVREFAGVTGRGEYQWYFAQVAARESYDNDDFFNTGWWDFYFDELLYRYNHLPVAAKEPSAGRVVKWFRDVGWVAVHKKMHDPENHLFLLTKSSPYGSVSHSHGDQNSILLHAYGEPLLIESGYYIGFNSSMHRDWRRQTRSQNNLLIGGVGQYAGFDKPMQLQASGRVETVEERERHVYIRENATDAYRWALPHLMSCQREIYWVDDAYIILVDSVELERPESVEFLLHTLHKPQLAARSCLIAGEKAKLSVEWIYLSSGMQDISLTDQFDGVAQAEREGLENQWHLHMSTRPAQKHVLVTCLLPDQAESERYVTAIQDDQGHDIFLYFSHEGKDFSICIDGNKRY